MKSDPDLLTQRKIDRLISTRFTVALMNDSKWERLIDRLTDAFEEGIHFTYKLIHSDALHRNTLVASDFKPFFREPTLYREIEWIEFPDHYEDFMKQDNHKAGKKFYDQDVSGILAEIQRIGEFDLERLPSGLRIRAYR